MGILLTAFKLHHSDINTSNYLNPIALRKAKIAYNFGFSACNRVKTCKKNNDLLQNTCNCVADCVLRLDFSAMKSAS